jgi:hypothetical protein
MLKRALWERGDTIICDGHRFGHVRMWLERVS